MKSRVIRVGMLVALGVGTMGGGTCPSTTTTTGGGGTTTTTTGGGSTTMSTAELQLAMNALAAINSHRTAKGLLPLTWHAAGAQVGFQHSLAMQTGGFFDHINPTTGTDPATRAKNASIIHDPLGSISPSSGNPFVGENLFMTTDPAVTGQAAVDAWVGSPGHHTQIDAPLPVLGADIMPPWTHCGIGVRQSGGTSWWTAMFFRNPN